MREMNQTGDRSNFVQIGDAGRNNTYNVTQNAAAGAGPSYVQLEIDQDSVQRHPKAVVEKQALRGSIIAATPFLTTASAIIADWYGILSYLGLPKPYTMPIGALVGFVLVVLGNKARPMNVASLRYWVLSKFTRKNDAKHIGLNQFLEVDDEGNYLTYRYGARCVYPKCNGKIVVEKLPPREECLDGFAGLCSAAGRAHSYLIDYNLVATRRELDWSPKDPPSYNPGYGR